MRIRKRGHEAPPLETADQWDAIPTAQRSARRQTTTTTHGSALKTVSSGSDATQRYATRYERTYPLKTISSAVLASLAPGDVIPGMPWIRKAMPPRQCIQPGCVMTCRKGRPFCSWHWSKLDSVHTEEIWRYAKPGFVRDAFDAATGEVVTGDALPWYIIDASILDYQTVCMDAVEYIRVAETPKKRARKPREAAVTKNRFESFIE